MVTIHNNLNATIEASLRPGSPERWTLTPVSILLPPKQSVDVQLRLRVLRFAQRRKAQEHGQRDVFHIKACTHKGSLGHGHFSHAAVQRAACIHTDGMHALLFCRPHTLSRSLSPHSFWRPWRAKEQQGQRSKRCQDRSARLAEPGRRGLRCRQMASDWHRSQTARQSLGLTLAVQPLTARGQQQHPAHRSQPLSQKQGICSTPLLTKMSAALVAASQTVACRTRKEAASAKTSIHSRPQNTWQMRSVCVS